MAELVTVNHKAVGLTPTWRDFTFLLWNDNEKPPYSKPHLGEYPLIPINFLWWSKGFPSLPLDQFTETPRARSHFLEKICDLGMCKSQFLFLGPGFSLEGLYKQKLGFAHPKITNFL